MYGIEWLRGQWYGWVDSRRRVKISKLNMQELGTMILGNVNGDSIESKKLCETASLRVLTELDDPEDIKLLIDYVTVTLIYKGTFKTDLQPLIDLWCKLITDYWLEDDFPGIYESHLCPIVDGMLTALGTATADSYIREQQYAILLSEKTSIWRRRFTDNDYVYQQWIHIPQRIANSVITVNDGSAKE